VQERLEREDDLDLVQTAPNVGYEAEMADGEVIRIERPSMMPDPGIMAEIREPIARMQLIVPGDSLGTLMKLCSDRRAVFISQEYLSPTRVMLTYDIPLAEIIFDFYDRLKSATRGYGTIDYEVRGYQAADLVRMRILVGGYEVDALSMICHRSQAEYRGRRVIEKLRKEIPRHMFEVPLQAAVGAKIIARETIKALRKNVLAKCYGGDISRKRKLLEKQKEGKKRMKNVGNVEIPQAAFLAVLSANDE
jgi:GTP-binding protein LepA